ncbi:MAG: ATP-dependent DNA helicase RecG [Flavobacteriales bacterium]|nr:ATP-dependent DNA helicase RecG [Flavobacteriales bacterium]
MSILDTKIEFLKGVGPRRASYLNKELSIFSFYDLLTFFPFRYIDRSKLYLINQLTSFETDLQIMGAVKNKKILGSGKKQRLIVTFFDKTGFVELVFFKRIRWLNKFIKLGQQYLIFGKPVRFNSKISFIHPEIEEFDQNNNRIIYKLYPVYHSNEKLSSVGLNSKGISKLILELNSLIKELPENLSNAIILKHQFISRKEMFLNIHFPLNSTCLHDAIRRFKFEELFFLQISILTQKLIRNKNVKSFAFSVVGDKFNLFYKNHLSFELTGAQKKVMKEIRNDTLSGFQMNRLLQGDVGSGKTIISFMTILIAIDNGFQACLMAPTEILANQHYESLMEFSKDIGIRVGLLTGKIKRSEKKQIIHDVKNNLLDVVVGTHALIQDEIVFCKLGLVIIDEQHKFGVSQRLKIYQKYKPTPHVLVMTATPIPRTLAMTAYGDLDVSIIDELPPNRKVIKTIHFYEKQIKRVYQFIFSELQKNKQVYIVYPLIEESKVLDYKNLIDGYDNVKKIFETKGFNVSMIHGRLKKDEKEIQMQRFVNHETQIMVSTTVIEVGVNVPNASIMVINNAEKFGLSQLHQLRGRVGRSSHQSFCFLISSNKLSNEAKVRLKSMVDCHDGFNIAEVDLKLRGPGDVLGTKQSGVLNLKLSSLVKDYNILNNAREDAKEILKNDPSLSILINKPIKNFYLKYHKGSLKWGSVA